MTGVAQEEFILPSGIQLLNTPLVGGFPQISHNIFGDNPIVKLFIKKIVVWLNGEFKKHRQSSLLCNRQVSALGTVLHSATGRSYVIVEGKDVAFYINPKFFNDNSKEKITAAKQRIA